MTLHRFLLAGLALFTAAASALAAQPPLRPVPKVDLNRYAGPWRVIAFMENKAEGKWVDGVETYRMEPKGKVAVHFAYKEKTFAAPTKTHDFTGKVKPDGTNANWSMNILPLFSAKYVIIDVTPDYSVATVAHPSRKYGWILARQKTITPSAYARSIRHLQSQGYDTTKMVKMPQLPSQAKAMPKPA